ncbi:MAG: anti-sigma factor antagonist [Leptospiraceae bacterium]|nr:anti-sigma factor antagonist [Leptospiraceae bacterium]MCP5512789.1 anti-sigma factor antagonist [Leptospiraceae bacterium]
MEIDVKLEKPAIVGKKTHTNHLLVKLKTPAQSSDERHPLVIGLAIDKSWSMKGEKLESTIEAASALVNWLTRNDYICIVAYSADVQIVQPLIQLKDKMSVIDKIRSIQVATSTNLSGGWLQALKIIDAAQVPNAYKRVILLTDGQATLGIKEPEQFNSIAADHLSRGITTTTIGFGDDFNEESMKDIAASGGGNFYFINSPEEASGIFFREFGDIGSLYGQAVELKMQFPRGVRLMEVFNDYPCQIDSFGAATIQTGDIRADDVRSVVVSIEVNPELEPPLEELVYVQLSFYNLFNQMKMETVSAKVKSTLSETDVPDILEVTVERLVYSSAKTIIKAAKLIKEGEIEPARTLVNAAIDRVESNLSISPDVLNTVLNRLKNTASKLKENANNVSKHFIAAGTELHNRTEFIDTGGVETHDRIFEYQTLGDIDLYRCPDLKAVVQTQMKEGYKYVIFDLDKTKFVDSSGIGAMIQISGWLRRRGGEFIVANISDSVQKVFEVTRLENHIRVSSSVDEGKSIIESIIQATHR